MIKFTSRKLTKYDDVVLDVETEDGEKYTLEGAFTMYTGESMDEYPTFVAVHNFGWDGEDK